MFKLKSVSVKDASNTPSIVEFTDGLNIIYGPSNCGKTFILDCIDYAMGSSQFNNDDTAGIVEVKIEIATPEGDIAFTRPMGGDIVNVDSHRDDIQSGEYSVSEKKSMPSLNSVWLKVLGIDTGIRIFSSEAMKTQNLTFRTLLHLFLVREDDAFKKKSALLPPTGSITALKSALLYLLYRTNCSASNEEDNNKKLLRGEGLQNYLNEQINELRAKIEDFDKRQIKDPNVLRASVQDALNEIDLLGDSIADATVKAKALSEEILVLNDKISECDSLKRKYKALKSQYASDVRRMQFIIDGDEKRQQTSEITSCPFCGGDLKEEKKESCVRAAVAELSHLIPQIEDLKDANKQLQAEIDSLTSERDHKEAERKTITASITKDLKPRIAQLHASIAEMNETIRFSEEKGQIIELIAKYNKRLSAINDEKKSLTSFEPNSHFEDRFEDEFTDVIAGLLADAHFENFQSCHFSVTNLDVDVNGKKKEKYGKGYRAFINTLIIYGFHQYLHVKNGIEIGTFIIDSPILSLKEKDQKEHAPDSMKASLFKMFVEHHDEQIIIIENKIPDIDYTGANMIPFTQDNFGRYGFINNYRG